MGADDAHTAGDAPPRDGDPRPTLAQRWPTRCQAPRSRRYPHPGTRSALHLLDRRIERTYGIAVEVVGPLRPPRPDVAPGDCCNDKVSLLEQALAGRDGWISGISRGQTESRRRADLIGLDRRGKVKINPLAQWSQHDRERYISHHDLVVHPLVAAGYPSIGCEPCTTRPDASDDPRSGRWAGTGRTECGLHL